MNGDIETRKVGGRWVNVVHGSYDTQGEAAADGRRIARQLNVEWFLRSRLGRFRLRNTYTGHDPRKSKD